MGITSNYLITLAVALVLVGLLAFLQKNRALRTVLTWTLLAAIVYLCYQNFPVSLTLLTLGTGVIFLIDQLWLKKRRQAAGAPAGVLTHNAREFFPILLIVWVIRSFIIQPYQVPTGSLEPTIMPGDFIAVKQFSYGVRFPIGNFKLWSTGEPKIGDIVLFYFPPDPTKVYIKRTIGTPGDHIVYKNKVLYVNGQEATQEYLGMDQDVEPGQPPISVKKIRENLNGVQHEIFVQPFGGETEDFDIVVPPGQYFMMGDNRDDSADSRVWGFVPEQNIIGKAFGIWMHWDPENHRIGFDRIGKGIH